MYKGRETPFMSKTKDVKTKIVFTDFQTVITDLRCKYIFELISLSKWLNNKGTDPSFLNDIIK